MYERRPTASTSLRLPAWWVRSFAESAAADEFVVRAGLCRPLLGQQAMSSLALLLSHFQDQILRHSGRRVVAQHRDLAKHCDAQSLGPRGFGVLMESVGGLRVCLPDGTGDGAFLAAPLFADERWTSQATAPVREVGVELSLADVGAELLLGKVDAYAELGRQNTGRPSLLPCLDQPPLIVPRAIWLELKGVEQVIVLRLFQAMQWEASFLQLQGVYGMALDHLLRGWAPSPTIERVASVLRRVGRRLEEHGLAREFGGREFLALGTDTPKADTRPGSPFHMLQLVWRADGLADGTTETEEHEAQVARYFAASFVVSGAAEAIARVVFREGMSPELAAQALGCAGALAKAATAPGTAAGARDYVAFSDGRLLPAEGLFLEWLLRAKAPARMPLPRQLRESSIQSILDAGFHEASLAERFRIFCETARALRLFQPNALRQPGMTLTAAAPPAPDELSLSASTTVARSKDARVDEAATWSANGAPAQSPGVPSRKAPSTRQGAQTDGRVVPDASAAQRRRYVEHLESVRRKTPETYASIKSMYIGRLDDRARQLFEEVEQRMQPDAFATSLNQRIASAMVQNPEQWSGITQSQASAEDVK